MIQTVKITATGDCTLGATQTHGYAGSFHEYYDKYGQDYFFKNVRSIFEQDDFTLINLECVLSNATERVEKTWNLKGKPEYVGIMTDSSVEGASLGNNHTFDYGQQGLDDTREVLNKAGIIFGFNDHVDTYTTKDGIKIGIVSASQLSADETHAGYIRDGIAKLREEGADLVIACCHWGIEGDHYPNDYQQKLAHQVIDWGAALFTDVSGKAFVSMVLVGSSSVFLFASVCVYACHKGAGGLFYAGLIAVWACVCVIARLAETGVQMFLFTSVPLAVHGAVTAASFCLLFVSIGKVEKKDAYSFAC